MTGHGESGIIETMYFSSSDYGPISYSKLNQVLQEFLGLGEGSRAFWSSSSFEVVYQVLRSLSDVQMVKKSIGVLTFSDPILHPLGARWMREGFKVKNFKSLEAEAILSWIEENKKSLLCMVASEVDLVTGEIFVLDFLKDKLQELEIPLILLQTGPRFLRGDAQDKVISLYQARPNFVIGRYSEKLKMGLQLQEYSVQPFQRLAALLASLDKEIENQTVIQSFEASLQLWGTAFFPMEKTTRLFDRAVIVLNGVRGVALAQMLPQLESYFVSACNLGSLKYFTWLHEQGVSAEQMANLLIVPLKSMTPDLPKILKDGYLEIQKLQQSL